MLQNLVGNLSRAVRLFLKLPHEESSVARAENWGGGWYCVRVCVRESQVWYVSICECPLFVM